MSESSSKDNDGADSTEAEPKKDKPRKRVSFGENKVHVFNTVEEGEKHTHQKIDEKEGLAFKNAKQLAHDDEDDDASKITQKSPDTVAELFSVPERKVTILVGYPRYPIWFGGTLPVQKAFTLLTESESFQLQQAMRQPLQLYVPLRA